MKGPTSFSTKIDPALGPKMEKDLIEQGFVIQKPPHTFFSAKKEGISCTLYLSGSLVIQGKEISSWIEFYLEPEILQTFSFSHPAATFDETPRIGMDEAGKGDFFGPLCIAALYADQKGIHTLQSIGVRDSKTLSDKTILAMARKIKESFAHTTIRLFPAKYNELYARFKNLNTLLAWTHVAALKDLSEKTHCKQATLDQFANPHLVEKMMKQKGLSLNLEQKTKGESDIVVAGASILARAAFVDGMEKLSQEYQMSLPKGASSQVITVARAFEAKFGKEKLPFVAKTHFKTMKEI